MFDTTDPSFQAFLEEAREHLGVLETSLLALEEQPGEPDEQTINAIFRAAHTIKGTAGFFSLVKVKRLAHSMENVLGMLRERMIPCTPEVVTTLLVATDQLAKMIADVEKSEDVDIEQVLLCLGDIENGDQPRCSLAGPGATMNPKEEAELAAAATSKSGADASELPVEAPVAKRPVEAVAQAEAPASVEPTAETSSGVDAEAEAAVAPQARPGAGFQPMSSVGRPTPPPSAPRPSAPEAGEPAPKKESASTIRVNLTQLDRLMMLAGELVLTRNSLLKKSADRDLAEMINLAQRVDTITSQLQDGIMATRMQPVGTVFSRFRRVVRDLALMLGKRIELEVEGEDVELDKPLLEALADPLTHIVRNSADHGIEKPEVRRAAGKSETGRVKLHAFHDAGQVVIEAQDDGGGIDPERVANKAMEMGLVTRQQLATMSAEDKVRLIFAPGFSTAAQVTDVSGRGVGMDVVATSIARVGGTVDVRSVVGKGTTIVVHLPLTLAIIPSLLVGVKDECFAIPQVNLVELVRVPAREVAKRIERVGAATVMRLRGDLLPLVRLSDVLGVTPTYRGEDGAAHLDRRALGDRRDHAGDEATLDERRHGDDRRHAAGTPVNVVVVTSGNARYGLLVDQLLDSEEIVVKPLSSHLKSCGIYAGATILGDGRVALILDIAGLCATANVTSARKAADGAAKKQSAEAAREQQGWLLAENAPGERFGIPLELVSRVERIASSAITDLAGKRTYTVGETLVGVAPLEGTANVTPRPASATTFMVLCRLGGREYGIPTSRILDVLESTGPIDSTTHAQAGIFGSTVVDGGIVLLVDVPGLVTAQFPEAAARVTVPAAVAAVAAVRASAPVMEQAAAVSGGPAVGAPLVMVVEDSPFFRSQIVAALTAAGIEAVAAGDGEEGLTVLEQHGNRVSLVLTDIEMPKMNGLELTRRIRADARYAHLPVVAVSTLSGTAAERNGAEAGVTDYLVKLDREELVEKTRWHLEHVNDHAH